MFLVALIVGACLALFLWFKASRTPETTATGTPVSSILKSRVGEIGEILVAIALPAALFVFAMMFNRVGWVKSRDSMLVGGIVLFVVYTVTSLTYASVYKNRMASRVLYIGLPPGFLVLMGLIAERGANKQLRDFFYLAALGTIMISFVYFRYVSKTKSWWDWASGKVTDTQTSATEYAKSWYDYFYSENIPEEDRPGVVWGAVERTGAHLGYSEEEMNNMYTELSQRIFGSGEEQGTDEKNEEGAENEGWLAWLWGSSKNEDNTTNETTINKQ